MIKPFGRMMVQSVWDSPLACPPVEAVRRGLSQHCVPVFRVAEWQPIHLSIDGCHKKYMERRILSIAIPHALRVALLMDCERVHFLDSDLRAKPPPTAAEDPFFVIWTKKCYPGFRKPSR
ncbi:MAG: hypothetical protein AMJ54_11080 [Deltaproteobacteria bacterium SG8_13]|nr:MAG: hypothetical protein AMJ54_11080 [Deltaproteobacteria bacterium SG8_13]